MRHLRIDAEVDAWPLCSPPAFAGGHVAVAEGGAIDPFRVGLRERLARYGPAPFPEDPADARWGDGAGERRLFSVLSWMERLFGDRLRPDGGNARLRHDTSRCPEEDVLWWRFFSLRVPPEIALAGCAVAHGLAHPPQRVELLHPLIRSELPTAHLHLHIGGMGTPGAAWAEFLVRRPHGLLPGGPTASDGLAMGIRPADEHRHAGARLSWDEALVRAAFAECALAAHASAGAPEFERWSADNLGDQELAALWELARGRVHAHGASDDLRAFEGRDRLLDRIQGYGRPTWRSEDCTKLLVASWRAWKRTRDPWLERVLVQLLRVRCFFHQALAMDPSAPGLPSFRVLGERLRKLHPPVPRAEAWRQGRASRLRVDAIELRSSLPSRLRELLPVEDEAHDEERGWVLLLSRSAPRGRAGASHWARTARRSADAVCRLIERVGSEGTSGERGRQILRIIRGFDLAGEETDGPLWLFAPILKELRRAFDDLCASVPVAPPGLTVHVGESFRHLATGLRSVHEPLLFGLTREGDRLGHALALGLDPTRWVSRHPRVHVPRWERLLDLAWLRHMVARFDLNASAAAIARMQAEERAHLERLCVEARLDGKDLIRDLGRIRFDEIKALETGSAVGSPGFLLVQRVASDPDLWDSARELVPVQTGEEGALLTTVRDALCAEIANRQLVIEVNPTSNLLIADMDHPLDQPMFHLRPVTLSDGRPLPICISADDPLQFCTSFDDELAYAWAGMVGAGGVPASYARQWIDDALRVGWRARFTLPRRAEGCAPAPGR